MGKEIQTGGQDIMGKIKTTRTSFNFQNKERKERPRITLQAFCSFFVWLPEGLNNRLKRDLKRFIKNKQEATSAISMRKHKESSSIFEVSLEKQLQAWYENPTWMDQPPVIKVTVPKGSLSHLSVKVNVGFPPDAVYNIVTDPDNKRVFKNIQEVISRRVLVDEGTRQVVDLEQAALWKFLWWSGTIPVHVLVDQNREDHSMRFKQVKTDYMRKFEGCWKVEPVLLDENMCHPFKPKTAKEYMSCTKGKGRIGSLVSLEQIIEPAVIPPPPISWYLRGITIRTTEMLINDLLAETARIRGVSSSDSITEQVLSEKILDKCSVDQLHDIKERWELRRKNARQHRKRLSLPAR